MVELGPTARISYAGCKRDGAVFHGLCRTDALQCSTVSAEQTRRSVPRSLPNRRGAVFHGLRRTDALQCSTLSRPFSQSCLSRRIPASMAGVFHGAFRRSHRGIETLRRDAYMNGSFGTSAGSLLALTPDQCTREVAHARSVFQRTLVAWAGDALELRRRDGQVPCWESSPSASSEQAQSVFLPMNKAA